MKNSDAVENMVNLISRNSGISESLIRCHNLIAQCVPVDEFDPETQSDLYDLYEVVKAIKLMENEVTIKSEDVKLLKAQITELQKRNDNLTLKLEDNREFLRPQFE